MVIITKVFGTTTMVLTTFAICCCGRYYDKHYGCNDRTKDNSLYHTDCNITMIDNRLLCPSLSTTMMMLFLLLLLIQNNNSHDDGDARYNQFALFDLGSNH